jgi:DNA-directed RNA polymerase specialized sigma24 family protein
MIKKKKYTDEEIAAMNHQEFTLWFMDYNKKRINRFISRRMIPNRYSPSDIKAYMVERILEILEKREQKGNPIEDPKTYFYKLIDFWCIEFQRMQGFIYCMPKRPRCPDAEKEISKHGFVYFSTASNEYGLDTVDQLGYIDADLHDDVNESYVESFSVKGQDPDMPTEAWEKLMLMVFPEDRDVLECIFRRDMSVPEASRHLGIAISTAYSRKERGLRSMSGTLASFVDLDDPNWKILSNVSQLEDESVDISQFFHNLNSVKKK